MPLVVNLDNQSSQPVYVKIANAIKTSILDGTLQPGQILPSARELAENLSVARITVQRSYRELSNQGLIQTSNRGSTFVHHNVTPPSRTHSIAARHKQYNSLAISKYAEQLLSLPSAAGDFDTEAIFGAPHPDDLPYAKWRQCLQAVTRLVGTDELFSPVPDSGGYLPLRQAIADLISRSRAIRCPLEQLLIFPSTENGFDLLCRLLLNKGDTVAVEDPGFASARFALMLHGVTVKGVPVDDQGLKVDSLESITPRPKLVLVTPSHQDPTGAAMSLERRHELLKWAAAGGTVIIEDDFDCEFRYGTELLPSLMSMDKSGVVIYRYNFWKVLFPLVRVGFCIVPPGLLPAMQRARRMLLRDIPAIPQAVLAEFISKGYLERHLHRLQKSYSQRRARLIQALTLAFGAKIRIGRKGGGTTIIVSFEKSFAEAEVVSAARSSGLHLQSIRESHSNRRNQDNQFTICFASMGEEELIRCVTDFKNLLA